MTTSNNIYPILELIDTLVFKPCRLAFSDFEKEPESKEYAACTFKLGKQIIKFRLAKITPLKIGQFVTLWKRNGNGATQPFDISDDIDFYLIVARQQERLGLFIFTKNVLHQHKILSDETRDGKRGMRVYPGWDLTACRQAQKTQQWQVKYFLDILPGKLPDIKKVQQLFNIGS